MTRHATLRITPGCENCVDGFIRIKKEFGFDEQVCECAKEAEDKNIIAKNFQNSQITSMMVQMNSIESVKDHVAKILIQAYNILMGKSEEAKWLFIHGSAGTGKTYVSLLLAQVALLYQKSVLYVNVPTLMEMLRPKHTEEDQKYARDLYKYLRQVDVLIVDDIGQEKPTAWVLEQLYTLINDRYNLRASTIFTSNYDLEGLKKIMGVSDMSRTPEAICSRISHLSQVYKLPIVQRKPVS